MISSQTYTHLNKNTNQAIGLAEYALEFLQKDPNLIHQTVYDRVTLFHTDSVLCGISAVGLNANAPNILRNEAVGDYQVNRTNNQNYTYCFGSKIKVQPEKGIAANISAVREWDSNGTVFGYNPQIPGHQAGEFGHNDFYPVVIAACQSKQQYNGKDALRGMILLDEIRGRLAEVFSLKTYKIDHVVFGAIASAIVYGALLGATVDQIESAVGMTVAHYIPWRAIRAGEQLSDSKGASAALSTEVAILSVKRAISGFVGPKDIFRNPEALFRKFEPTQNNESPFNIVLTNEGEDFAVMKMHFKLGLYEHQSAGAIEGLLRIISQSPLSIEDIDQIVIKTYEPAFGIIGDLSKRNPQTRQSADHSMVYIIATLIKKAIEIKDKIEKDCQTAVLWKHLMLTPIDYHISCIKNELTQSLMRKITFLHGGKEFDDKYPQGIPTCLTVKFKDGNIIDSGLIMFPEGHASCDTGNLEDILKHKFQKLGQLVLDDKDYCMFVDKLQSIGSLQNDDLQDLYYCDLIICEKKFDI